MNIKKYRENMNYSQNELAEIIGVKSSTLCQWENGKRYPRIQMLPRIAEALGCTVDELIKDDVF